MGKIIGIAVLVIFSAYFSATETAFTSVNRIRIKNLANDGDRKAKDVLELTEKFDSMLSTILVGNNIVHTLLRRQEHILHTHDALVERTNQDVKCHTHYGFSDYRRFTLLSENRLP